MTNISHVPSQSLQFAERFMLEIPGFIDSEELKRLDEEDRKAPGLVFAALAAYVERSLDDVVGVAARIIEDAAAADDGELHNYLVTEIFEQWHDADPRDHARLVLSLGPHGRRLYDQWMNLIVPRA